VVFSPVINGKTVRAVEFTRVLHVADLWNNVLSALYLTRNIGFTVHITASQMSFERPTGTPLFVASISNSNVAFLDGSTVPLAESASAATTLTLDIIQITLGDDSQCTVLLYIYLITELGDDSQCTRGKAVQLQIKYLSR